MASVPKESRALLRRVAVLATVGLAAVLVVVWFVPATNGPLAGGPGEPGGVQICIPAGTDREVYFGAQLTNEASRTIEITSATMTDGDNVASIDVGFDLEGPELGQRVGTMAWPTEEGFGYEEELLARLVPADDVELGPGQEVSVIISVAPEVAQEDAELRGLTIEYSVGVRKYVKHLGITFRLVAQDC